MIHILFLILKIIGFVILGILLLLLLILLMLLFSSVKYTVNGCFDLSSNTKELNGSFRWLFSLISGHISYEHDCLTWRLRLFWKKISSDEEAEEMPLEIPQSKSSTAEQAEKKADSEYTDLIEKNRVTNSVKDTVTKTENSVKVEKGIIKQPVEPEKTESSKSFSKDKSKSEKGKTNKKKNNSFYEKVTKRYEKLKYTFSKMCDNMKLLLKKKDRFVAFIKYPAHQAAAKNAIYALKQFLKKERPKKGRVEVEFGFEDPSHTGYLLAALSMVWPFFGSFTEITPNFEEKVLSAHGSLEGRIAIFPVVVLAVRLIADKNVRITFKHIKKM